MTKSNHGPTIIAVVLSFLPITVIWICGRLAIAIGAVKVATPWTGYRPPHYWIRILRLYEVRALDGSQLQVDKRGLVRLVAPTGEYMTFGVDYTDTDGQFDFCDVQDSRPITFWADQKFGGTVPLG